MVWFAGLICTILYTCTSRCALNLYQLSVCTSYGYLYTSGSVRIEKSKCYISLLAYQAEEKLWSPVCKEPNKASEWPSSFVQKRLPRYKDYMVGPVSQQFITCSSLKEPHSSIAAHKTKTQQLSLEKSPVPSFIPNFFPQRSSLEARGIFVIGWDGPSDPTCHAALPVPFLTLHCDRRRSGANGPCPSSFLSLSLPFVGGNIRGAS